MYKKCRQVGISFLKSDFIKKDAFVNSDLVHGNFYCFLATSFGGQTNRKTRIEAFSAKTSACQTIKWQTQSDNDFAEVTEEMTLENINFPTVEALQTFLSIRNKSSEGDLETLVKRLVLLFFSANIFWFT